MTICHCLVGLAAARQLNLAPGSHIDLRAGEHGVPLTVAGIISAGGAEDSQIFTSLEVAQNLAALPGRVSLVQLSVSGTSSEIEAFIGRLANALPGLDVRPVRQLAAAEGDGFWDGFAA